MSVRISAAAAGTGRIPRVRISAIKRERSLVGRCFPMEGYVPPVLVLMLLGSSFSGRRFVEVLRWQIPP